MRKVYIRWWQGIKEIDPPSWCDVPEGVDHPTLVEFQWIWYAKLLRLLRGESL